MSLYSGIFILEKYKALYYGHEEYLKVISEYF